MKKGYIVKLEVCVCFLCFCWREGMVLKFVFLFDFNTLWQLFKEKQQMVPRQSDVMTRTDMKSDGLLTLPFISVQTALKSDKLKILK